MRQELKKGFFNKGFTLIELMIIVAILALLMLIAIPKFGELISKAKESSVKGGLGVIRSVLNIYYSDNEGRYPNSLTVLDNSKWIESIPTVQIPSLPDIGNPGHLESSSVEDYSDTASFGSSNEGVNIWAYVSTGAYMGQSGVNCTHLDSKQIVWSAK